MGWIDIFVNSFYLRQRTQDFQPGKFWIMSTFPLFSPCCPALCYALFKDGEALYIIAVTVNVCRHVLIEFVQLVTIELSLYRLLFPSPPEGQLAESQTSSFKVQFADFVNAFNKLVTCIFQEEVYSPYITTCLSLFPYRRPYVLCFWWLFYTRKHHSIEFKHW